MNKFNKALEIALWSIATPLLITYTAIQLFYTEERYREKLIHTYSMNAIKTNLDNQSKPWSTSQMLQPNEVLACVIGSYGFAEDLIELNIHQKTSIPKYKLPSQDGSWYLLYFSDHQVERISLHENIGAAMAAAHTSCGGRDSQFSITNSSKDLTNPLLVVSFIRK